MKWREEDTAFLLAHYPRLTVKAIARRLGRGERAVNDRLDRLGRSCPQTPREEWEAVLRRLHRQGKLDAHIAPVLGCSRREVTRRRHLLGLPSNSPLWARARYKRQMRSCEVKNLLGLRQRRKRIKDLLAT